MVKRVKRETPLLNVKGVSLLCYKVFKRFKRKAFSKVFLLSREGFEKYLAFLG